METLKHTIDSLWQVVLVGLLLGAGLPAIFAVGLKALSIGEARDDGSTTATASSGLSAGSTTARPVVATAAAALCFAVVIVAIVAGILFIMKDFLDSTFGISVF
ncbi:hypothetical protein HQ346_17585 [Rhodococcus sp. BP-252]|uniref:hypothetical protein n=1 Tax=unclassified Rhodococcus (in: high G+C Gram-positive bacteria) TaxID=192944 RepID=UPI00142F4020|nr:MULTISPECIES: hypothetical protein [unclassified Rhodococcus (in: high G+C Gram-positive bacteria)]MBY6413598.1 hypothetical protein [Rhodococcus sp. BP-320]MBY6418206.1 hypothetical protein [Rhodococcus sp. BP-321]MBY6424798.1 hypothetical protein [Rhodococcus sp. BP-324]MBY6428151.1 hypothetical protein [Rhodococcus sp. BP-323]MBY6433329.1 hypothetical protein [Rhodococcus sp. BP-322]